VRHRWPLTLTRLRPFPEGLGKDLTDDDCEPLQELIAEAERGSTITKPTLAGFWATSMRSAPGSRSQELPQDG
jgi:hypothetical protein